jgi:hypothetical protein
MYNLYWLHVFLPHVLLIYGCLAHDVFVVNFLSNSNLELKLVTIGLLKAIESSGATMVIKLWAFLNKFSFMEKNLHMLKMRAPTHNVV